MKKHPIRRRTPGIMILAAMLILHSGYGESAETDDALHIDADGRVGIGTPSPEAELDVSGRTKLNGPVGIGRAPDNGQQLVIQPDKEQAPLKITDPSGKMNWLSISPQGTVTMSGAKVGIGTETPEAQLDISGDARIVGNTRVGGDFTHRARYQRDDQPLSHYDISPRYHLSLTGNNYSGKTRTIPQEVLEELCADPDGCQVRLAMTRWYFDSETESASVFFTFYYSAGDGHWRASATDAGNKNGVDGKDKTQHVREIWKTCYLTDGVYDNGKDLGDNQKGMQLLVWTGYKNPNRTCECTLID